MENSQRRLTEKPKRSTSQDFSFLSTLSQTMSNIHNRSSKMRTENWPLDLRNRHHWWHWQEHFCWSSYGKKPVWSGLTRTREESVTKLNIDRSFKGLSFKGEQTNKKQSGETAGEASGHCLWEAGVPDVHTPWGWSRRRLQWAVWVRHGGLPVHCP